MNPCQLITDDAQAKAFLASENMLQTLIPQPPFDHVSAISQNATAFIGAAYDEGHADPADNGYTVLILPKSHWTKEEAAAFLYEFRQIGRKDPNGPCTQTIHNLEPALN
jgi:hypothetical protein